MNLEFTEEQKEIKRAASEFAAGEFDSDLALEFDKEEKFPFEIWKKACGLGFVGMHFPEEYGGSGLGILENAIVVEELCRRDSGLGTAIILSDFASDIILMRGSEEQKEKYLTPLTKGKAISSGGFTEPDHGSDITIMSTTATEDGDEFVINGTKAFITNGGIADYTIVLCQTDPDVKPTYRGESTIIVEKDRDGFEAAKYENKMGLKMVPTAELSFNDVRVPKENLVGTENKGFYQALEFFDESRIEISAQALGIGQGAFDRALNYAREREQFGRKLSDFQVIRHKLSEMATKLEAARFLVYRAAWNFDQGRIDRKITSMAKEYASSVGIEVVNEAIQIFGGYGYMTEYEVERFYRDIRITQIYEGTTEIQKNTIAGALVSGA
ncbi:MAG: acyl-CoA dehydrogenase family protein [Halobacteriota archaeon]|nr:acyl-CoA dehydrogenase family protein [Halobacteriota archaeon]